MAQQEDRKYQRHEIYNRQRILNLASPETVDRQFVVSKNISATGTCVRSKKKYGAGDYIVIRIETTECEELINNRAMIMKLGNYILGRIIWSKPVDEGFYENGVSFLNQADSDENTLNLFTRLLNQDAIDIISQRDLL